MPAAIAMISAVLFFSALTFSNHAVAFISPLMDVELNLGLIEELCYKLQKS
jgi:hypothetical protein